MNDQFEIGERVRYVGKEDVGIGIITRRHSDGSFSAAFSDRVALFASAQCFISAESEAKKLDQIVREERERVQAELAAAVERERIHEVRLREEAERERLRQVRLLEEAEERKQALLSEIDEQFHKDYLSAEGFYRSLPAGVVSEAEFESRKVFFVRRWFENRSVRTRDSDTFNLDSEQLAAIACVNGNVQVVARAGSGKTATLVNRALFLLEHCKVASGSLLLLAFNRKAAIEIRRRLLILLHVDAEHQIQSEIDERAGVNRRRGRRIDWSEVEADAIDAVADCLKVMLPHVMTFHALAYALVHPEQSILFNGGDDESQGLSRAFQQVIDDHLQIAEYRDDIRELMLAHFREDWDRIVAGRFDQTKEELLAFRRSLPRECLGGEYVKSYGEKIIADFLFEHDITYRYERNHWWGNLNYRPDFTIFKSANSGVIIEYFGLEGDADYDEMSQEKRLYWQSKQDWDLIECAPSDIARDGDEGFRSRLKLRLEELGVKCSRLTENEIWQRVRDRAIDRFTSATVGFAGRCRKLSLTPDQLQSQIDAHEPVSPVEKMFLSLAHRFYEAYLESLSATGEEDFDGLMQSAATVVADGMTKFERKSGSGDLIDLRYIFIDEFQDFSDLFYRLLGSIRKVSLNVELFCVGDDWQAINGFSGSDLKFFERFEDFFGKARRLYISTNYRSAKSIVSVGNALMSGLGKPAAASKSSIGVVALADACEFRPSIIEKQRHPGDVITPMVSRIANKALAAGSDVVLLSRRNMLPWFVNFSDQVHGESKGLTRYLDSLRSLFPKLLRERISISTTHRYKGLEKPMVIVADAVTRSYPLVHPDWVFSRVLGESLDRITREERRLLYVALTRATEKLVIITDGQSRSPFLDELETVFPLTQIDWHHYPPVRGAMSSLIVKVGNQGHRGGGPTFAIKDQLKACRYQWQTTGWPGWAKTWPAQGFQVDRLQAEVWAPDADGIDVRIYSESEDIVGRFLVDHGQWVSVVDELAAATTAPDQGENDD